MKDLITNIIYEYSQLPAEQRASERAALQFIYCHLPTGERNRLTQGLAQMDNLHKIPVEPEPSDLDKYFNIQKPIKTNNIMGFTKKPTTTTPAPAKAEIKAPLKNATERLEGIMAFEKHPNAPDFIICDVVINPETLGAWIDANPDLLTGSEKFGNQLKIQLKRSKDGKLYFAINDYKKA